MTRDQDLERQLTDFLSEGPVAAPIEVVDRALEHTDGRRQRDPVWGRLMERLVRLRGEGKPRSLALPVALALTLLLALVLTMPLGGGIGPAPAMDPAGVRNVSGTSDLVNESRATSVLERELLLDVGDARIDGGARQVLHIEESPNADLQRTVGIMRLENDWGAWEGVINGARYPDGTAFEYGWLTGEGAYEGYTYFHSTYGIPAGTERVIEGAIWPGEPPPMPDPSLLP